MWNALFGAGEPKYVNSVNFTLNGQYYTVADELADGTSLNTYIRDVAHLKGTKYMCEEGGCGACIVTVTAQHPVTNKKHTFSINSCLTPIWACDGWEIQTVEDLGNCKIGYHPVQATLARFNGTQCGFCSPGMVMSMFSLLKSGKRPSMVDVENSLGGNICRCTGYRPILDAFKSLSSDATPELKQACSDIEDCYKMCSGSQCEKLCELKVGGTNDQPILIRLQNTSWYKVRTIQQIFYVFNSIGNLPYKLVAGNTAEGVYKSDNIVVFIDIKTVAELRSTSCTATDCIIGANITLKEAITFFESCSTSQTEFKHLERLAQHIKKVANPAVRNIGTIAGNLSIKRQHREFPSDIFTILEAAGAKISIMDVSQRETEMSLMDFLQQDMDKKVITKIRIPSINGPYIFRTFKVSQLTQNSKAYVNAAFLVQVEDTNNWKVQKQPRIVYGGINPQFVHASNLETYLQGKRILKDSVVSGGLAELGRQLIPDQKLPDTSPMYRKLLAQSLWYKFLLGVEPKQAKEKFRSGSKNLERPLSSGKQEFQTDKKMWPLNQPIPKIEGVVQCSGEAEYVNDIPSYPDELHGAFVLTKQATGNLAHVNANAALSDPDVVAFFQYSDIPGLKTFTPIGFFSYVEEDETFCSGRVRYSGQAVGLVVAQSRDAALRAAENVIVEYTTKSQNPVLSMGEVLRLSQGRIQNLQISKQNFELSNVGGPDNQVIKGEFEFGRQYHFHMENQTCLTVPTEDGFNVHSATQWTDVTQAAVAGALKIPASKVNVLVRRLGGAFGGKLTKSTQVAVASAIAAQKLCRPVRIVLPLTDNMEMQGKRYPARSEYQVEVDARGKIKKLDVKVFEDNGAYLNESVEGFTIPAVRNCYDATGWNIKFNAVRTDTVPSSYCRAPGTAEGVAIIEEILENIANTLKLDPVHVRLANMDPKPENKIPQMITSIKNKSNYEERLKKVQQFNLENRWKKRGLSIVPMAFGIVYFDNYRAQISILHVDGSVIIHHAGVEMGQGINTKVVQVAAHLLGVPIEKISIKPTDSSAVPNVFGSAASISSESVVYAVKTSCEELLKKLEPTKTSMPGATWEQIISKAYINNVDLVSSYMFSTKDNVQNYPVHGVCLAEAEVDVLTGERQILRVDILEDVGQSMSPLVDVGQIEGAFVMGMGYWLSEESIHDPTTGRLLNNRTWNYKPLGAKDIPVDFRVYFKNNSSNPVGVLQSKATGEPAFVLSVACYFAIKDAIKSARKDAGDDDLYFTLKQPATPENILLASKSAPRQFEI